MILVTGTVADHVPETVGVHYLYKFTVYLDQLLLLEAGKQAADRFNCEAEVIGNVISGHAQIELGGRKPPAFQSCRQADE